MGESCQKILSIKTPIINKNSNNAHFPFYSDTNFYPGIQNLKNNLNSPLSASRTLPRNYKSNSNNNYLIKHKNLDIPQSNSKYLSINTPNNSRYPPPLPVK